MYTGKGNSWFLSGGKIVLGIDKIICGILWKGRKDFSVATALSPRGARIGHLLKITLSVSKFMLGCWLFKELITRDPGLLEAWGEF
jgi:hypothetical protein